MEHAV